MPGRALRTAPLFEARAHEYDAWFRGPVGAAVFPAELAAVRMLLQGLERPWLEVGVGTGAFAAPLGVEVGLDPSVRMLGYARRAGVAPVRGVAEALPFAGGTFGAILLLVTLCFADDPPALFAEARRVLQPGGGLVVGEVPADSPWGRYYREQGARGHPFYSRARFYTVAETEELLSEAGLTPAAYASTLRQPPSEHPYPEPALEGRAPGAGFVCILARNP